MKEITINKNILTENSEILQSFFKDVSKYKIYEDQIELARKAKNGDEEARNKLITSNLRFVITCAKQYVGQGVPLIDLIQCGTLGLIQSIENFDPDRGYKFISFAVWYIRRELIKAIYNTGRTIRYPITYISKINKVKKTISEFINKYQREPTEDEIIELTNLTQKQYDSTILNESYCSSIDTPLVSDNRLTLKDVIPGEDNNIDSTFTKEIISKVVNSLNEREYKVISEFYGIDGKDEKSIKEIAKEMNLGDERVRQLRKSGIKKLKQRYETVLKTLL